MEFTVVVTMDGDTYEVLSSDELQDQIDPSLATTCNNLGRKVLSALVRLGWMSKECHCIVITPRGHNGGMLFSGDCRIHGEA